MADYEAERPLELNIGKAQEASSRAAEILASGVQGELAIELRRLRDNLWVTLRRPGSGGLALRVPLFGEIRKCSLSDTDDSLIAMDCTSEAGRAQIKLRGDDFGLEQLRLTVKFTAAVNLGIDRFERDLVPLDESGDPLGTQGRIEAQQRRLNTGLLYFSLDRPQFGKVLYIQNLTALNDYFTATNSKPEDAVGGEWPNLGYLPPVNEETGRAVLPAGRELTLYDTILVIRRYPLSNEAESAWQFLDMLGAAYPWLNPPAAEFHDWKERSERTIHDLAEAPEARIEHYGRDYFHPYTASEYPDSMVQLSIASALDEWGRWTGDPDPMLKEILDGLDKFYDPELRTLRRYLPNVGVDKNADAVDSWYLYHPLLNLANLAKQHPKARQLFLDTIDYGIHAAQHFGYKWPIMYDVRDFSVIQAVTENDRRGQTDVGGIYAWVMLQGFELTRDRRYIDEAERAIKAAAGMRFDLNYQANLTAWGAAACIRLWRITGEKEYLTQSYVYLASFFHNSQLWKSEIAHARHYTNFMGVTCLQDAPYMAAYECFDSFAAFERYLDYGGPDLVPSVQLLVAEFCRYALDRAWYYYPDALPEEAVASENIRNGYIKRELNFPVEDLYPDGQPAGQVGQEIYGAGAAMVYATRSFHRIEGAPFMLFCDHFVRAIHQFGPKTVSLHVNGMVGTRCRLILIPLSPSESFTPHVRTFSGETPTFAEVEGRLEAEIAAGSSLVLTWE